MMDEGSLRSVTSIGYESFKPRISRQPYLGM